MPKHIQFYIRFLKASSALVKGSNVNVRDNCLLHLFFAHDENAVRQWIEDFFLLIALFFDSDVLSELAHLRFVDLPAD
jgi:hypothetical protein